jgi:hypothetical protein
MHVPYIASEAVRSGAAVYAGIQLWYCYSGRTFLIKRLCAGKRLGLRSLSEDSQGRAAVGNFVVVVRSADMPARRVFRHAWRDSTHSGRHGCAKTLLVR